MSIFMLFSHKISFFFYFLCSPIYNTVYPKYSKAMKKMPFNEIENFIFENYHKRIGFSKENSYYLLKLLKKRIIVSRKQINRKNT